MKYLLILLTGLFIFSVGCVTTDSNYKCHIERYRHYDNRGVFVGTTERTICVERIK